MKICLTMKISVRNSRSQSLPSINFEMRMSLSKFTQISVRADFRQLQLRVKDEARPLILRKISICDRTEFHRLVMYGESICNLIKMMNLKLGIRELFHRDRRLLKSVEARRRIHLCRTSNRLRDELRV